MPDSLRHIITIPQQWSGDTTINTDIDQAAEAAYSISGTDILALSTEEDVYLPSWQDGLECDPRNLNIGDNVGVMAIVTGMFVVMLLCYRSCSRLFSALVRELSGRRRQANVFDERTTHETRMMVLMACQWSVYTGLLLYTLLSHRMLLDSSGAFTDLVHLICLTGAYYVFQLCAYNVVGYTFASPSGRKYLVRTFSASQSLLGFALVIPSLVAIFYPGTAFSMLCVAVTLYFLARITFIAKGFRIFYQKIDSLFYFILYLCSLEIIPIILLYNISKLLVTQQ